MGRQHVRECDDLCRFASVNNASPADGDIGLLQRTLWAGSMLKTSKLGQLSRFARDRRGVSAVEFAIIAPVMIGLYLGCVEVSDGVAADRKVSLTAATVANLAAEVSTISTDGMTNILDASSAIMAPFSANNLKITVSCLSIDRNNVATVKWSETRNGTKLTEAVSVPSDLTADFTPDHSKVYPVYLIYSQVSYDYTPIVGYTISGTLTLSDKMYSAPRITAPTYNNVACT
jgi:Flp pilus assembly protein TadG